MKLKLSMFLFIHFTVSHAEDLYFTDATANSGISWTNTSGKDQQYIVEGMMGGAAFFDFDNDGDVDLYVTNGSSFHGFEGAPHPRNVLFRNDDGYFQDVTIGAAADTNWSMGCVAADYDNNGLVDLYVTNFGPNSLLHNKGDGVFEDLAIEAGINHEGWGVGAAFADYDRDGYLDLYVANYVDFSLHYESPIPCMWKNIDVYCGPIGLLPAKDVLYRNLGNGSFEDVTLVAGLDTKPFFGMGALWGDYNSDGWADIFVADDSTPNKLYKNNGDGTFAEEALIAGVAYSGEGVEQGCMGAAYGDFNRDGLFDIVVTNFADENNAMYRNEGNGFFSEVSFEIGIGSQDRSFVAWGTGFFDGDNDGDLDLFIANGHTYPEADMPRANSSYKQRNSLFENRKDQFFSVAEEAGPGLEVKQVSRGAAFADYDGDGDIDIFVVNLNAPPTLLRNEHMGNNYAFFKLIGNKSNRDGIGARVQMFSQDLEQWFEVQSGTSYLSHNDLRIHSGLGSDSRIDSVEIFWPSGIRQMVYDVAANQVIQIVEEVETVE